MFLHFNPDLKKKARNNRNNPTTPEAKIWYEVLSNKKTGYKFLRQKPIKSFIVDFYCSKLKLAIEIDGDTHGEQEEYDKKRTEILNEIGIKVVRYINENVMKNIEGVYEDLMGKLMLREKEMNKKD